MLVLKMISDYNFEPSSFKGLFHSLYCPECKVKTRIEYEYIAENNDHTYFAMARCIDCERMTFFQYKDKERDSVLDELMPEFKDNSKIQFVELIHAFPFSSEIKIEDIPDKISKSYLEGVRCLDSNAPNGAVSMFRKFLQQICVDLGADSSKRLVDQISILPSEIIPTATEIRQWGNLGTHEDNLNKVIEVTSEQAQSIKKFLERIFLIQFQHPAEIKRLQDTRT